MKAILVITIGLWCFNGRAQARDTLFTNENHNVALFFPEKIRQAVVGAENYVFSYNQEHPQFFGLLKGSPGTSSNLLAITQDGQIYSYILTYKKELPELVYFLDINTSLGNEESKVVEDVPSAGFSVTERQREFNNRQSFEGLEKQAAFYHSTTTGYLKKVRKEGTSLLVNSMNYNRKNTYVVLEIINNSPIDFEPEYLRLYLVRGNKRKNTSYQKLLKEPILRYNFPKKISSGEGKKFVYVFPKFTVGNKEHLELELREKEGNRYLKMSLR